MAMSRMAMLLVLAGSSASAQQRHVTAEEAMEIHRKTFSAVARRDCGKATEAEEIVVCGKVRSPYRLPFPPEPVPGERVAGELPSAVEATKEVTCTNIGQPRGCPYLNLLGIALVVGKKVAEKAIEALAEDE